MANFQVLFSGVIIEGFEPDAVRAAVAAELGIDERKSVHLFSGKTVVLRSQLAQDAAIKLCNRLETIGIIARVKDLTPKSRQPVDYEHDRNDKTMRDLTAAHTECPRCSHMQLESSHCARCGVDMEAVFKQLRKEDLLIEKKLRDLRAKRDATPATAAAIDAEIALSAEVDDTKDVPKTGKLRRWFSRSR